MIAYLLVLNIHAPGQNRLRVQGSKKQCQYYIKKIFSFPSVKMLNLVLKILVQTFCKKLN